MEPLLCRADDFCGVRDFYRLSRARARLLTGPGAARNALAPGYLLYRLRRVILAIGVSKDRACERICPTLVRTLNKE